MGTEEGRRILPLDILTEILLRLPVRFIVRFRCVCKLWRSITYDPHFMERARTTRPPAILLIPNSSADDRRLGLAYVDNPSAPEMFFLRPGAVDPRARNRWCNGLVLSITGDHRSGASLMVMNPSTSECLTIPKPPKKVLFQAYLGYHPVTQEFKVLGYFGGGRDWRVCTVGTTSWRQIHWRHAEIIHTFNRSVSAKGTMYWKTYPAFQKTNSLISFDLGDEKFRKIQGPNLYDTYGWRYRMIDGQLAELQGNVCLPASRDLSQLDLWMLDADGSVVSTSDNSHYEWSLKYTINFPWMDELPMPLFIHNDKILMLERAGARSKRLLRYHHLKSNSGDEREGGDDEQVVDTGDISIPAACLPHVESLISLPKAQDS